MRHLTYIGKLILYGSRHQARCSPLVVMAFMAAPRWVRSTPTDNQEVPSAATASYRTQAEKELPAKAFERVWVRAGQALRAWQVPTSPQSA